MPWCVVPAAGRGARLGGERPKQYQLLDGVPLLMRTLERLASHPRIDGIVVALAADDPWWPGIERLAGKPVIAVTGGAERADSVLAGLAGLPAEVGPDALVLVHDAARPCVRQADITRLIETASAHPVGAILAVPVTDTIKQSDVEGMIVATVPRSRLWRALTPQAFRREALAAALADAAHHARGVPTDEAQAMEWRGQAAALVEGAADNIKVTLAGDLALAAFLLAQQDA
jgi:2-C-methyl-D-erythritol 4-phosphate cytidylyltransferase